MLNIIKKSMLTGIGLALIAKDEVEDLANEFVKKGKMSEKEGTKFLEDLRKRYDETQKQLEERVQQAVKDFMKEHQQTEKDEVVGEDSCPHDLEFAVDFEEKKACEECDAWEKCAEANEKL